VCCRIVVIVRVRALVLTTCYRGVLGLHVHGRADNTNCGRRSTDGEMRGGITESCWGVAISMMGVGFIGPRRVDEEVTGT
jgi:hypothetical protein